MKIREYGADDVWDRVPCNGTNTELGSGGGPNANIHAPMMIPKAHIPGRE